MNTRFTGRRAAGERSGGRSPHPPELLPIVLAYHATRYRIGRLRHGEHTDRGAISTELALAVIALVALAAIVLAAITRLGQRTAGKVDNL